MRILLASAVAIAPLMAASGAMAEVVISTARTTPITTSNATGTGPDSIRIASGGSVAVASGVAVTLDSSHSVDIDSGGAITMANSADGSTGILVNGGNTGNVIVGGAITVSDNVADDANLDTDKDGTPDGPFATGANRYGVRVVGATPLTGSVVVESSGAIKVEGDNSAGVSVEAPLTGNLDVLGTVAVTGSQSYGVHTTGAVGGDVRLAGTISARGEGATAVAVDGDVDGQVKIHSSASSTGYRYTTAPQTRPAGYNETADNDASFVFLDELQAEDLLQGGSAVRIAGNVGDGVLLDRGPSYASGIEGDDDGDGVKNGDEDDDGDGTINRNDTDRDGDGLLDASETTASITTYGSAPALAIGSTSRDIAIGAVGTGDAAYGLINRGTITAYGVYDGVSAAGVQIGGTGHGVVVAGGVRNEGTITARAVNGAATGVRIGAGATAPSIVNTGVIDSQTASTSGATAQGLRIDAGAVVNSFTNSGTLSAIGTNGGANAVALSDASGTLTSIFNTKAIQAGVVANQAGDPVSGTATAIDVSANTTGVTLVQSGVASTPSTTDPDTDGDGVTDSNEPTILGAVRLGSGADVMDIRNGTVAGDISFGAGADSLSITGGATVRGALSDSDGQLSINVANGLLDARQTTALNITSLTVGGAGDLLVTLDPANTNAGGFRVNGTATLADGAGLGVRFNSLVQNPGRFTVIDADVLNYGAVDLAQVTANSPYLYVVQAGADAAAADVYVDVRRRTAQEAGLIPVEASAYDAVYGALGTTGAEAVRNAFLAQTSREGFVNLYEQLLPDHSGGPLLSLASGVDAVTRALTGRNASAAPGETSAWLQEINFYADKDRTDTYGFRSEGFGVAGGVERGTGLGALGVSAAFTSSDLEDPEAEAEEVLSASLLELGLYWRAQGQYWTTWARAAAGYASFNSDRRLVGAGLNLSNTSDWHGMTLSAAAGASYERSMGRFTVRPEGYLEYFSLSEDAHSESGGGAGFDLDIDERDGHIFSAVAAMNIGMRVGDNDWIRPELRLGWRQNISVDPGETIARFSSGGPDFTLSPASIEGGGPIAGLRLNIGNELGMLTVSADAEMIEDYVRYMLFMRASFRF